MKSSIRASKSSRNTVAGEERDDFIIDNDALMMKEMPAGVLGPNEKSS